MENAAPSQTRRSLNPSEPARRSRRLLFFSLALNVALLLFLAVVYQKPQTAIPLDDNQAHSHQNIPVKSVTTRGRPTSPWQQLESTDLAVYAANLHAAGCPTKTMRDILLPLIEEQFDHSETSLAEPTNFWASFSQRQAVEAARAEKEIALRQQKDIVVKELLGFAWSSEGLKQAYAGRAAESAGFVDHDRAEKLFCIADRFEKPLTRPGRSHRTDRLSTIYHAWHQEMSEILSATELEEAELRQILVIVQRHNPNLCGAALSGSELRQLMIFRRDLCNPLPSALVARDDEPAYGCDPAAEQQFNARVRSLLGENRFIDYLRSSDATVERTLATLEKEHLPKNLALQLFDLRQDAVSRAQEIRQQPIRRAEKRAQLATLRQSAMEQLAQLSNATEDSPLFKVNWDWLQEIKTP